MKYSNIELKTDDAIWKELQENWTNVFDASIIDAYFKYSIDTLLIKKYAEVLECSFIEGDYHGTLEFIQLHKNDFVDNNTYFCLCGICHSYIFHNKIELLNKLDRESNDYILLKEECISDAELALSDFEQEAQDVSIEVKGEAYYAMADICGCLNRLLNKFRYLMRISPEASYYLAAQDALKTMQIDYADVNSEINTCLRDMDYFQRQFIFVAKKEEDIAGRFDDDKIGLYFPIKSLPAIAEFPFGHPQTNTLYYAHPLKEWFYIPFEEAEQYLFDEKVRNFIRLVQCLGATDITFRSVKGHSLSENISEVIDLEVGGEVKGHEGNINYNSKRDSNSHEAMKGQRERVLRFNPRKAPYIPKDVAWLSVEPDWQSLVKQRLEGNMLHYRVHISSRKTMAVTDSRMDDVKVAFKAFVANAHVNYTQQMERSFQREEETEWVISVKFKPLEEFNNTERAETRRVQKQISDAEQEYLDSVRDFLEDDAEITSREHKMLDRIRQSLGISEERAQELEASLSKPQLTEDEQEYLDMYREYAEKGDITEKERHRLDKFAMALGIQKDRTNKLEMM